MGNYSKFLSTISASYQPNSGSNPVVTTTKKEKAFADIVSSFEQKNIVTPKQETTSSLTPVEDSKPTITKGISSFFKNISERIKSAKETKTIQPASITNQSVTLGVGSNNPIITKEMTATPTQDKVMTEVSKLGIKTGAGTIGMITSSADFLIDTLVSGIDTDKPQLNIIRDSKLKFKDLYKKLEKEGKNPINEFNNSIKKIQESEFLKPSEEFQKSSFQDNLKQRPLETVLNVVPSVVPSIILYSINPALGLATTYLSTANDIEDEALKYGVDEKKATALGAGASIFISLLDKIVPNLDLATKTAKNTFISNMTKKVFNVLLKSGIEASTEAAQETIQMAAEKTFRDDLGLDEAKTRLEMSAFGGALGGGSFGILGNLTQDLNQDVDFKQNISNQINPEDLQDSLINSNLKDQVEIEKIDGIIKQAKENNSNLIVNNQGQGDVVVVTPEGDNIGISLVQPETKATPTAPIVLPKETISKINGESSIFNLNREINEKNAKNIVSETLAGNRESDRLNTPQNIEIAKNYNKEAIPDNPTADTMVTVSRAGEGEIQPGDHVVFGETGAERYLDQRENSKLATKEVPLKDLVRSNGVGSEAIYSPYNADKTRESRRQKALDYVKNKGTKLRENTIANDIPKEKLDMLSADDKKIMFNFIDIIARGGKNWNLMQTGKDIQAIVEGLGIDPHISNDKLAGVIEDILINTEGTPTKYRLKPTDENKLLVQHNLSEEALTHANKMGGLAVPSLAISGKNAPVESFGEITLIGDKNLIRPSSTSKVYGSDVYSPRYPKVDYSPKKGWQKELQSIFDEVSKKVEGLEPMDSYIQSFEREGRQGIADSRTTKVLFYVKNNKNIPSDFYEIRNNASKYVEDNNFKYQTFVDEIVDKISGTEQIFQGFTYSGNRKYKAHTLENVVNIMKKDLVNAEGFNYGVPNIRASLAKRFKSIEEIQKNRDKIISKDEMEELKTYFNDKFESIAEKAVEGTDRMVSDFATVVADGIKDNSLKSDLAEFGYKNVDYAELENFLTELKTAPTEYFEAKLKRAVDLSEFKVAVVPHNVSKATLSLLESKGLKVYKYGRDENQGEVVAQVAEKEGTLFRLEDDYKNNTGEELTQDQLTAIEKLQKQFFEDTDLKIVGQILTSRGQEALGAYREGMIKILNNQANPVDTFLHESVHKYLDVFLTAEEQADLLLEAEDQWGGKDFAEIEEKLAENFISYYNTKELNNGKIRSIFDKFIERIKSFFKNRDTITKFYEDIIKGKTKKAKTEGKNVSPKSEVTKESVENVKNIRDVKTSLKNIKDEYDNLTAEAEGMATVAQEQRQGLNTGDIAKLKRIYARSQKFQEGDIETIRKSNTGPLLERVVEDVMIKYPEMSDEEALDFALNLPNKNLESVKKSPAMKKLIAKQKTLNTYLDILTEKQKTLKLNQENEAFQEWQDVLGSQEKLVKTIGVPSSQLPVGEGKEKVSRLEARVQNVLENTNPEIIEKLGLSTFNELSKKENIAAAAEYALNNPDDAIKVLSGEIEPPKGILRNAIYVAMQNQSIGDVNLAMKLASITSTRLGQEIGILTEIDPNSPVKAMSDIIKIREETFKKKYPGQSVKQVKEKIVKEIKSEVKKISKNDWNDFINSIKC